MGKNRRTTTTKVWHNPDIAPVAPKGGQKRPAKASPRPSVPAARTPEVPEPPRSRRVATAPVVEADPREGERQKLLHKLLTAEGPSKVARAAADLRRAGFDFPREEDVQLSLLEHSDEDQVCAAIDVLGALYREKPPKRRGMLESRLRRIEEMADEARTREAAAGLRRSVSGRGDGA